MLVIPNRLVPIIIIITDEALKALVWI